MERAKYGVDERLHEAVAKLSALPNGACSELDRLLEKLGPHHLAHYLITTPDREAASALQDYLKEHWPAYLQLVERLVRAARRTPEDEDLLSDFGDS
jgi:hypothetical protein